MAKNSQRVTLLITYLLANASKENGVTMQKVRDDIPNMSRPAIARIFREHPAIKVANYPLFPPKYYADPSLTQQLDKVKRDARNSIEIRPELKAEPINNLEFVKNFKVASEALPNIFQPVVDAAQNAVYFTKNQAELMPETWTEAQQTLDTLEKFAATLYQRVQHIKNDSRYDSPEWWAIFSEGMPH